MSLTPITGTPAIINRAQVPAKAAEGAGGTMKSPAVVAKATEGDEPTTPSGIAKWCADKLVKVGGDIKKLPTWQKVVISVVGFFVGWKFNDWVHKQLEKKEGETFDKYGQDQYRTLKGQGDAALVAELGKPHSFTQNIKDWDILQKKWGAFNTYAVLAESMTPTLGDHNGKANAPVALIALSGNKTADENAMKMLAADIKRRANGAPAKQAFYADVVKNLKDVHGITVSYDQA